MANERNLAAWLSGAIALSGVLVSATNMGVAIVQKNKDIEIAGRKDLRDFVAQYRAIIFGSDRAASEQIRNVMRVTFSDDLLASVLPQIVANAPANTRDLFSTSRIEDKTFRGPVSTWGGPNDNGVTPEEGLALFSAADIAQFPDLFLREQPPGTTGLARRLNPRAYYISARWNYAVTSIDYLKRHLVTVTNPKNGKSAQAQPVDWGPPAATGRVADLSFGLAQTLGVRTGDEVEVKIP
jgi:hypothetical protein